MPAPRDLVFDTFTRYETYSALPIVLSSKLLVPGQGTPSNGEGAIREIKTPTGTLKEQVMACCKPQHWDYHFLEWPMPIPHAGGRMSFAEVPGGTEVHWATSYELPDTLIGNIAAAGLAVSNMAFLKMLAYLLGKEVLKQGA